MPDPKRHAAVAGKSLVLFHAVLGLLPIDVCSALGDRVGRLFAGRNRVRDERVRHNLAALRPDLRAPAALEATVRRYWSNAGRTMTEFSVVQRLLHANRMEVVGLEHLVAAREAGRPRICLLLHLGNFEMAGTRLVDLGESSAQVTQRLVNPYRDRTLNRVRRSYADKLIPPGPKAGFQMLRILKGNGAISMAGDEYVGGELFAPSFGRPVRLDGNLARAVRLAKLTDAVICPYYCSRLKGAHFRLEVLPPVPLDFESDFPRRAVEQLDAAITPVIVAHLDQWLMLDNFRLAETTGGSTC